MNRDLQSCAAGAVAGLVATGVMSLVMITAQRLARYGKQPPQRIVEETLRAATQKPPREEVSRVLAVPAHFAFGAVAGALFAWLGSRLPRRVSLVWPGVAYGMAIWAASYTRKGWVPALGIMPPAERDRPGRVEGMIAAHVVFGSVLGALLGEGSRLGEAAEESRDSRASGGAPSERSLGERLAEALRRA